MNRMNRTLASLKWSLLSVLAIGVLGLVAGEPVRPRAGDALADRADEVAVVAVVGD
jgi:hypothetical protein